MFSRMRSRMGIRFAQVSFVALFLVMTALILLVTRFAADFGEYAASQNETSIRTTTSHLLAQITQEQAGRYDAMFQQVAASSLLISRQAEELLKNAEFFGGGPLYPGETLALCPQNGIFTTGPSARSEVLCWNTDSITSEVQSRANILSHLDPLLQVARQASPLATAVFVQFRSGVLRYHPNTHFAPSLPPAPEFAQIVSRRFETSFPAGGQVQGPVWETPYLDQAGQGLMVTVRSPIHAPSGEIVGAASVDVTLDKIRTEILGLPLAEAGKSPGRGVNRPTPFPRLVRFLLRSDGGLVVFPEEYLGLMGLRTPETQGLEPGSVLHHNMRDSTRPGVISLARAMSEQKGGILRVTLEGKPCIVAYHPMRSTGWSLGVVVPEEHILSSVQATRAAMVTMIRKEIVTFALLTLVLGTLMVALTLLYFFRSIVRPLRRLSAAAGRIQQGDFETRTNLAGDDEIGQLAKSFDAMAAELAVTMQALSFTQFAVDSAGDAIYWLNKQGRLLYVNESACSQLGYSRGELLSEVRVFDVDPCYEGGNWERRWQNLKTVKWRKLESNHHRKDGSVFPVEVTANHLEHNGTEYVCACVRDVSERHKSEEKLQRLAAAMDQAVESVILTSPDGVIEYVNPAFEKAHGYSKEEIVGRHVSILQSDRHDEEFHRNVWETIKSGRAWSGRITNRRKDGTLLEEEVNIAPVAGDSGNLLGYVSVQRDITERIAMEKQLQQAHKMEAIGQLAGGVAHDFNNILQVIHGFGELVMDGLPKDSPAQAELNEMMKAADRASGLVRQLLAFSRSEAPSPRILSPNPVIRELTNMLERVIGEHIILDVRLGDAIWNIHADPGQIEQVLMNLCVNARDAMPGGGKITIETSNAALDQEVCRTYPWAKPGDYVVIAVSDTGLGIPPEIRERIFEPFFTTKEISEGTGLGLATVYAITKQHGGLIRVESEPGQGTTFRICLPAAQKPGELPTGNDKEGGDAAEGGREVILLAEDDETVRKLSVQILEKAGYRVLVARDGAEALALFGRHERTIDMLLLDVIMPNKCGRAVYDCIKAIRPGIPVLFCSGYSTQVLEAVYLPRESVPFLQKPFTSQDLLHKVREVLLARG